MARKSKEMGNRKQDGRLSRRALLSGLGTGLAFASLASGKKLDLKMAKDGEKLLFSIADLSTGYITYGENVVIENDKAHLRITASCPARPTTPKKPAMPKKS